MSNEDNRGVVRSAIAWVRDNWNEETNLGKAKVVGVALLLYLLALTLIPGGTAPPHPTVDDSKDLAQAEQQASRAYADYTARIAELESEQRALAEAADIPEVLGMAEQQAAEAYAGYEARIAELEAEKTDTVSTAQEQAKEAYQGYESRIVELEQEQVTEMGAAAHQAADTYASYEARIAELVARNETQAARIADLERQLAAGAPVEDVSTVMDADELREQVQRLQAVVDDLVRQLDSAPAR